MSLSTQRRKRRKDLTGQPHRDRISRVRIPTDFKTPDDVSSITEQEEDQQ